MSRLMMGILCALISHSAFAIFLPLAQSHFDNQIIEHKYYTLSYSEPHEISRWVSYELATNNLQNCTERTNNFKVDPLVKTGSATLADYKGSGFDRGHLLPAGDMKWNKDAMKETFYMSNMTPQPAKFNRGKWQSIEELVRAWALKYKKIWIVTGPIIKDNLAVIGSNQVSVPEEYYKVILRKDGDSYIGIGILMTTEVSSNDLSDYVVSIKSIQDLTDINFFPFLEDDSTESSTNENLWDFKAKFTYLPCGIE